MVIRPYTDADIQAIFDVYASSKLDELRYESEEFTLLPLQKDIRRLTRLKAADILVAIKGAIKGDVIGYGATIGTEIRALYVHPKARRTGAGKKLLEHLLQQINAPAKLCVAKSNVPAKSLYKTYGFLETGEFRSSYNGKPVIVTQMAQTEAWPMYKAPQ